MALPSLLVGTTVSPFGLNGSNMDFHLQLYRGHVSNVESTIDAIDSNQLLIVHHIANKNMFAIKHDIIIS